MAPQYTIRDLTKEFDVSARALRFYEFKGLLSPPRKGSSRRYDERDRIRLMLTLRGKRIGLSLKEIKEIIDMYDPLDHDGSRQLLHLCTRIHARRGALLQKLKDIEATLGAMDDVEARCLSTLLARASDENQIIDVNVNLGESS